jgi:hypothetical protein
MLNRFRSHAAGRIQKFEESRVCTLLDRETLKVEPTGRTAVFNVLGEIPPLDNKIPQRLRDRFF